MFYWPSCAGQIRHRHTFMLHFALEPDASHERSWHTFTTYFQRPAPVSWITIFRDEKYFKGSSTRKFIFILWCSCSHCLSDASWKALKAESMSAVNYPRISEAWQTHWQPRNLTLQSARARRQNETSPRWKDFSWQEKYRGRMHRQNTEE